MKVWLVIPAYCEGQRLRRVLTGVRKFFPPHKIVVVDDGSKPIENVNGCILLRHEINLGKGAAMLTGSQYAFTHGAEAVIFMDADMQHDPAYLPKFLKHLLEGYDVVLASRRPSLQVPLIRLLGNKFASVYINVIFGVYVADILSGYRALTRKAMNLLTWDSQRYGVETEMIARLGLHKTQLKYMEFPIESIYIDKYKGVTIMDAVKILINSIWWKLS